MPGEWHSVFFSHWVHLVFGYVQVCGGNDETTHGPILGSLDHAWLGIGNTFWYDVSW